jgi:cytochrome c biogenesis protein
VSEQIRMPRLGAAGWARWAWRQLTSMRTALLLLLLLAVAAIPGSVLPQRRIDPVRVQSYLAAHPVAGPWLDRLGGFDVYASVWFSAIYLLLFVSLLGCVLPRSRQLWRTWRAEPPRTPSRLDRLPAHRSAPVAMAPDEALAAARAALRRRRYRVADHRDLAGPDGAAAGQDADGVSASLAAERGYLAEVGNLAFHLALLGVLVSVAAGSLFGWSGEAIVITGRTFANILPSYDSFRAGSRVDAADLSPFWFRLDDLQVRFEERAAGNQFGAPRDFRAEVSVHPAPGAPAEQQTLRVNDPLSVGGARVFLVGNGYAPELTVRDGQGRIAFSGAVPFVARDSSYTSTGVVKVPDALPQSLGVGAMLLPTAIRASNGQPISVFPDARNPVLLITAYTGDLGLDSGVPQSVYSLDVRKMKQLQSSPGQPFSAMLAPGDAVRLPGGAGTVSFDGLRRYAALDIRHDPSSGWALAAALLALGGLVISLSVRRRRVWVRVRFAAEGGPARTVVEVAGLARRDDPGLDAEIAAVLAAITGVQGDVPAAPGDAGEPEVIGLPEEALDDAVTVKE